MAHGGSLILIRDGIEFKIYDRTIELAEEISCEVSAVMIPTFNTVIVTMYRSPICDILVFFDKLHTVFASVHGVKVNVILSADFNINFLTSDGNTAQLCDLIDN